MSENVVLDLPPSSEVWQFYRYCCYIRSTVLHQFNAYQARINTKHLPQPVIGKEDTKYSWCTLPQHHEGESEKWIYPFCYQSSQSNYLDPLILTCTSKRLSWNSTINRTILPVATFKLPAVYMKTIYNLQGYPTHQQHRFQLHFKHSVDPQRESFVSPLLSPQSGAHPRSISTLLLSSKQSTKPLAASSY